MFLLPFLLSKGVLISLSLIVMGSATAYGGVKANDYRQTQIIVQEAKHLSSSGKYQEAINKLAEADNKWAFGGTKKEVEGLKEENKTLIQASADYELGKDMFDRGKYKNALDVLKKVDSRNINYPGARSLIELAEKNLDTPKGEVAGIKTEIKATAQGASEILSTPAPTNVPAAVPQVQTTQSTSYSYPTPQTQNPAPQPTYKVPTISDYAQNFVAVIYGFDLANKCYQQAISQITNGDRTGFNVTLDQCRSIVSPLQSIIHQNVSLEVKRVEYNLGTAWGNYNYLFSVMGSLSVSVDHSNADPSLDMFKADLKEQDIRYQRAVNYANEAIKEWQALSQ